MITTDTAGLRWTAARLAEVQRRLEEAPAWRNYLRVRDAVLRMNELAPRGPRGAPSAYWQEELANFEYMLDASPLIIDKLRHHTAHITGLRVYDYRSQRHQPRREFERKLAALRKRGGDDLLVPESPALGGFGFDVDGELYNLDTLKYYEALIALRRGEVLDDLQRGEGGRIVWEIGGGWGGFAYQFKRLCPSVTYVISDFPELFLFAATYVMSVVADAKVRFFGDTSPERLFDGWENLDFVFVPNYWLAEFRPPRLDLTVNMVSFQEMTADQVTAYVRRAFDLESPFIYSLNRDRSPYNTEIESVPAILERFFWPHDIAIMPVSYQKMLDEEPADTDYKHNIGWRRVVPL